MLRFDKNTCIGAARIALLTSLLGFQSPTEPIHAQIPYQGDVIELWKGEEITESKAPYYVSLNNRYLGGDKHTHYFGGAIISPNAIVTAGHFGLDLLGDNLNATVVNPTNPDSKLYWDEANYQPQDVMTGTVVAVLFPENTVLNRANRAVPDLAVACLDRPIIPDPSNHASNQLIEIASPDDTVDRQTLNVVGNGNTSFDVSAGKPDSYAKVITNTLQTHEACALDLQENQFGISLTDSQICLGDASENADTTTGMTNTGDSGSPITLVNKQGVRKYTGAVSLRLWERALGIFDNASRYADFIHNAKAKCEGMRGKKPPKPEVQSSFQFNQTQQTVVNSPLNRLTSVTFKSSLQAEHEVENAELHFALNLPNNSCANISETVPPISSGTHISDSQDTLVNNKTTEVAIKTAIPVTGAATQTVVTLDIEQCSNPDPTIAQEVAVKVPDVYYPNGEHAGAPVLSYQNSYLEEAVDHIANEPIESEQLFIYSSLSLPSSLQHLSKGETIHAGSFTHSFQTVTGQVQITATRTDNDLHFRADGNSPDLDGKIFYVAVEDLQQNVRLVLITFRNHVAEGTSYNFYDTKAFLPLISNLSLP